MRRRAFIAGLGGAVSMPLLARAQQSTMPVIGLLSSRSADADASLISALRAGLAATGFVEGQNVRIEYRWAHGKYDQLPALAAELVRMPVTVLVSTGGTISARAAKAATRTLPVVFTTADDPVKVGLVDSLNAPGHNLTGIAATFVVGLKEGWSRSEILPKTSVIGLFVNPTNPATETEAGEVQAAASAAGFRMEIFRAGNENDISSAFEDAKRKKVDRRHHCSRSAPVRKGE